MLHTSFPSNAKLAKKGFIFDAPHWPEPCSIWNLVHTKHHAVTSKQQPNSLFQQQTILNIRLHQQHNSRMRGDICSKCQQDIAPFVYWIGNERTLHMATGELTTWSCRDITVLCHLMCLQTNRVSPEPQLYRQELDHRHPTFLVSAKVANQYHIENIVETTKGNGRAP